MNLRRQHCPRPDTTAREPCWKLPKAVDFLTGPPSALSRELAGSRCPVTLADALQLVVVAG